MEVNYTNADKLRYTVTAAVNGLGEKLTISCIFRWTKDRKQPPRWAKKNPVKPCQCFFTKGGSQSGTSMIAWLKEVLLPWCASNGRRSDEWVCLIMDPATAHRDAQVKKFYLKNRIQSCDDAGQYDLPLSNDRCCDREALQRCYVRFMVSGW